MVLNRSHDPGGNSSTSSPAWLRSPGGMVVPVRAAQRAMLEPLLLPSPLSRARTASGDLEYGISLSPCTTKQARFALVNDIHGQAQAAKAALAKQKLASGQQQQQQMPRDWRSLCLGAMICAVAVLSMSTVGPALDYIEGVPPFLRGAWRATAMAVVFISVLTARTLFQLCKKLWSRMTHPALPVVAAPTPTLTLSPMMTLPLKYAVITAFGCGAAYAWWMGTFVVALRYTTIGDATLFGEVHCIFLLFLRILRCRKVSAPEVAGCVIAVSAGFMLAQAHGGGAAHGSGPSLQGNGIALLGALGGVVFLELSGKAAARLGMVAFFACMQSSAAVCLIIAALSEGPLHPMIMDPFNPATGVLGFLVLEPQRIGVIIFFIIVPGTLGLVGYTASLKYLPVMVVSTTMLLEPAVATVIGILMKEAPVPGLLTYVGMAGAMAGLALVSVGSVRRQKQEVAAAAAAEAAAATAQEAMHAAAAAA